MNPLLKVREAFQKGVLPEKEYSLIVKRFPIVVSGISRIEKASGVNFPIAYVEPSVTMSSSNVQIPLNMVYCLQEQFPLLLRMIYVLLFRYLHH